ncbi:MAG: BTAD domain-containing putative transcriptional regulator, partial [Streptosporangiaceae bacterium]
MTADDRQPILVRLLGPVRAWRGEAELALGAPRRRAVLALLAMRANRAVSRDELIDGIWGEDPPASSVNALHGYVAGLRTALEPHRARRAPGRMLLPSGPGYLLRLEAGQLDAEVFGQHLAAAQELRAGGDLAGAARSLDAGLRLWQSAPLSGIAGPWAEIERIRLGEQRLTAIEERGDVMLALGRHAEAAAQLAGLVREHPLREQFRGQLMLALYRCGRQAEALAAFADSRRVLVKELGIEPGAELRRLHERILAADVTLDPPAAPSARVASASWEQERPVPAQLPGDIAAFTGRARELAALHRLLAAEDGEQASGGRARAMVISALSGTAGVGKTALAVHWARRVADEFPDGQLYVNLRGYDPGQPMPPADALARFLRALGWAGQDIPLDVEERAAAYRTLLHGRRVLVVLDNAATVEQVRPLLPGSPSCLVVVTSRDSLAGLVAGHGAQRIELDSLPLTDAAALLRALIGERAEAEPDAVATLAAQCARLPLALRVAAELAAASPGISIGHLTGELADEQRRLDLLDAGGDARTSVRGVFSWSYRHLPADAARAFRLAGLHPGPDLDAHAVAALTAVPLDQARDVLARLARAHLVQSARPGRYAMHDLLRSYASQLAAAEDGADDRQAAMTSLFDYYLGTAASAMDALIPAERSRRPRIPPPPTAAPTMADPAAARQWLDIERTALLAVAAHTASCGWPHHATRLAATLFRYLATGGHNAEAIVLHAHALAAARQLGDRAAEATTLVSLGEVEWRLGRCPQGADLYDQALTLFREIGDRAGEAQVHGNLALIAWRQGRFGQASSHYERSLTAFRQIGDRTGEARALDNLGAICWRQGRYQQAAGYHQRALAVSSPCPSAARSVTGPARPRHCPISAASACGRAAIRRPQATTWRRLPCSGRSATGTARPRRSTATARCCSPSASRASPAPTTPPRSLWPTRWAISTSRPALTTAWPAPGRPAATSARPAATGCVPWPSTPISTSRKPTRSVPGWPRPAGQTPATSSPWRCRDQRRGRVWLRPGHPGTREIAVLRGGFKQLPVRAQDRPAAVEQENPVRALRGAYPVGDHDEGAIALRECPLYPCLRREVEVAGRLVKNHQGGTGQIDAPGRDQLPLAVGQDALRAAEHRLVPAEPVHQGGQAQGRAARVEFGGARAGVQVGKVLA